MAAASRRRRRQLVDLWDFATNLVLTKQNIKFKKTVNYEKRIVFIEIQTCKAGEFKKATHVMGELLAFAKKKAVVQPYNQSGEPDGAPDEESISDLFLFPAVGAQISLGGHLLEIVSFDKTSSCVELQRIASAAQPAQPKKKATPQKTPKKKAQSTKKRKAPIASSPPIRHKKGKPLDKVTDTSSAASSEQKDSEFTLPSVLKSFANPRNNLFMRSLEAEITKRPDLLSVTPEQADDDPPEVLFGGRRKGYFKCRHLCRVWVLQTLRWLRTRGEFFVVWNEDGGTYDGRRVLAHAFTIKYVSLHTPGRSAC